jgi:Mn2+/Fe2+ NRAMP family transporter
VLAGSAAYALGEARRWPSGLARRPGEAKAFYATIMVSTLAGMVMGFSPIDPIKELFWSAVLNGVVAVPLTVMIMLLTSNSKIMGKFAVAGALRFVGWLATSVMGIAAIGLIITSALNYPLLVLSRLTATSSS